MIVFTGSLPLLKRFENFLLEIRSKSKKLTEYLEHKCDQRLKVYVFLPSGFRSPVFSSPVTTAFVFRRTEVLKHIEEVREQEISPDETEPWGVYREAVSLEY